MLSCYQSALTLLSCTHVRLSHAAFPRDFSADLSARFLTDLLGRSPRSSTSAVRWKAVAPSWLTRVTCRWAVMFCRFLMCVRAGEGHLHHGLPLWRGPSGIRGLQPSSELRKESLQPFISLLLQHHIKYQHLLKKKYVCPHPSCGRLFRLQKQLLRHAKHHTGTGSWETDPNSSWNRGRVEGKPPVLTLRVKLRQVVQTCSSGRILLTPRLQSSKEMKGNGP